MLNMVQKQGRWPVAIAATGTEFTLAMPKLRGVITRYLLELPNYTSGTPTTTLSFLDANSKVIWSGAAHAENDSYSVPVDIEVDGKLTAKLTLSGASGGATTVYLTLWTRPF